MMENSDLVFIPVRSSQVVGLVVGWLAVALSMAAIGTASIARVGVNISDFQTQTAVSISTSERESASMRAPGTVASVAIPAPTLPGPQTVSFAQYAGSVTSARTTRTSARPTSPSATPQAASSSSVTVAPVGVLPAVVELGSAVPAATATPTIDTPVTTRPDKGSTKHPFRTTTTSYDSAVAVLAVSTWRSDEGAIRAACQGTSLAFVEPKAGTGYGATERTSWFRTSITFDGATKVSVRVGCSNGTPTFDVED